MERSPNDLLVSKIQAIITFFPRNIQSTAARYVLVKLRGNITVLQNAIYAAALCYQLLSQRIQFHEMSFTMNKGIGLWRHCGAASVGGCSRVQPCIRQSERRKADARNISFQTLYDGQFTLSTYLIIPYYPVIYNVHQEVWIVLKNFLYERTSHHAKLCFDRTYWLCYEANTGRSAMTYLILKRKV